MHYQLLTLAHFRNLSENCIAIWAEICEKDTFTKDKLFMQPEQIKKLIEAGLADAIAYVDGDGAHFNATVICPAFAEKNRIQKQQLVYDTVRSQLLNGSLHALSVKTFTPEEWQAQKE